MQNRSPINIQRGWLDIVKPALDAASILGSLALVCWSRNETFDATTWQTGLTAVVLFSLISQMSGLTRRMQQGSANTEITGVATTWFVTLLFLSVIGFLSRYSDNFARSVISSWAILAPAMIGLCRMGLRILFQALVARGYRVRRVAIAGFNDLGRQTAANIESQPALGLKLAGFYDDRCESRSESKPGDQSLQDQGSEKEKSLASEQGQHELAGSLAQLVERARAGEVDTIMITLPMRAEQRIKFLLDKLSDSTVSVYIVPDFFVFELLHSRWTTMGDLPAVSVFENPLLGADGLLKRAVDLAIAIIGLVAVSIPMLMIAIAVKLSSSGPVFFRQKRYGIDGREILVWKFRSMRTCDNGAVVKQATKQDPRITRVGAILRKTSLDELPQLFNVIAGTMSLVGPRPHASAHNEEYRGQIRGYMLRHKVKPGITGLAQVNGCRGETETLDKMERRIEWDHQYIRRWSLWLDLSILLKTFTVIWGQEEAY